MRTVVALALRALGVIVPLLAAAGQAAASNQDCTRDFAELARSVAPRAGVPEEGVIKTQRYYDILANPERALGVNLKELSRDLRRTLSPQEIRELTALFHGILQRAATNADGSPNAFAADNLNHVALHYRDIETHRNAIRDYFRREGEDPELADIALLVSAAHDLGKIAGAAGILSPEVRAVYDRAFADNPKAAFFLGTILGHDGLSMDGIANSVRSFGTGRWSPEKIDQVTRLLQAAIARHNAGYERLANDEANGIRHFWQTEYPKFAEKMRALGLDVSDTYPPATGGWVPAMLAMIDRGTSLHPSFVEKIAGQGNFPWTADAVGGLLVGNARSVRQEIDSIARELGRHTTRDINDFPLYRQYRDMAARAEELGNSIRTMNDFTREFPGRPDVPAAERDGWVFYRTAEGQWFRVHRDGLLQRHTGNADAAWSVVPVDPGMSAAQILMRRLVGYAPIDTAAPRTSTGR